MLSDCVVLESVWRLVVLIDVWMDWNVNGSMVMLYVKVSVYVLVFSV